jgi:hypothetical protein
LFCKFLKFPGQADGDSVRHSSDWSDGLDQGLKI